MNTFAVPSADISEMGSNITPLLNLSTMTKQLVSPEPRAGGNPTMKSMEISRHIRFGIGKGFSRPQRLSRHVVTLPQTSQLLQNFRTSWDIPGQKNRRERVAKVASRPGWPVNIESCVCCINSVRRGS